MKNFDVFLLNLTHDDLDELITADNELAALNSPGYSPPDTSEQARREVHDQLDAARTLAAQLVQGMEAAPVAGQPPDSARLAHAITTALLNPPKRYADIMRSGTRVRVLTTPLLPITCQFGLPRASPFIELILELLALTRSGECPLGRCAAPTEDEQGRCERFFLKEMRNWKYCSDECRGRARREQNRRHSAEARARLKEWY